MSALYPAEHPETHKCPVCYAEVPEEDALCPRCKARIAAAVRGLLSPLAEQELEYLDNMLDGVSVFDLKERLMQDAGA